MPACIWITGLSGAGKSTLAQCLVARLRREGRTVVLLDGDALREVFALEEGSGHHREARLALALRYGRLCRQLVLQEITVVIATISLFREVHAWNRANLPGYFEVYLKVPLGELRRRDPKGLYRGFDAGSVADVAGLDLPIDEPEAADLVLEFDPSRTPEMLADELSARLRERSLV